MEPDPWIPPPSTIGFRAAPLLAIRELWPVSGPVQCPGAGFGPTGQGTDVTAKVMDFGGKQTWFPSLAWLLTPSCVTLKSVFTSLSLGFPPL